MANDMSNTNPDAIKPIYKTYVSEQGLQTYHEKVKEALLRRALKTDLFSRNYNELKNKPITNDDGDSTFYITDNKSNIVAIIDEEGIKAINFQEKGVNLENKYLTQADAESTYATKEELNDNTGHFIGTYAEYTTAYNNGLIAVGTVVLITDDGEDEASAATTAKLGTAILGTMILGQE